MQAPVGSAATPLLASEVSRAGASVRWERLGLSPRSCAKPVRSIGRVTDRPFCVNLVLDFEQDERLEVALEEHVPVVSFSFGLRPEFVARARAGGARVFVQVGSADGARAAADAGADALIVQGVEAGGHVQSVVVCCRCWPRCDAPCRSIARRGRNRRPGIRAGGTRCWCRRCRDGHPFRGQR